MVFLHHAVASWPAWPEFAEIVGGRFHYQPGELDGRAWPDSGYRFDVTHTVDVLEPTHPLAAGLPSTFEITDEVYLFPVLTEQVVPVMRSRHSFVDSEFYSADRAIRGERSSRTGWSHPHGSDLVAWVKHAANSPVAYLQFGDGPSTYADRLYRQMVANAMAWAASPAAHQWARQRNAGSS
jgi:type 1 glutamine amidotransferase